ncbi:MAG TPA: hypothetical protein VFA18_12305, partial [Gemmataceae bacterium]|nr:hypothetical protein [Gemmataceae bacterium]
MNCRLGVLVLVSMASLACQARTTALQPSGSDLQDAKRAQQKNKSMAKRIDLSRILNGLQGPEWKVREAAGNDLFRLRHKADGLTSAEGLKALHAAAQPYPFQKPPRDEISEELVELAASRPRPGYIPVVAELFDRFADRAKWWAL